MRRVALILILVGSLMNQRFAYAELVGGKVINIDPVNYILTISHVNIETESQENISVLILNETTLLGLESFANIKIGDEIWAEAEVDQNTNQWIASSIQKISDQTQLAEGP